MTARKKVSAGHPTRLARLRAWPLHDAKTRLSEVVRLARESGPQRLTVHGRDAVVILSAEDFERLCPPDDQPSLTRLLAESPLRDVDFDREGERSPVRPVEL